MYDEQVTGLLYQRIMRRLHERTCNTSVNRITNLKNQIAEQLATFCSRDRDQIERVIMTELEELLSVTVCALSHFKYNERLDTALNHSDPSSMLKIFEAITRSCMTDIQLTRAAASV